jgi:ent-kaurene oxidase
MAYLFCLSNTTTGCLPQFFYKESTSPWALAVLAGGVYILYCALSQVLGYKYPVFGVVSQLEPVMISNFRFFRHAEDILNEGYQAVSLLAIQAPWLISL